MNAPKFLSSGDSAITVEFGNEISAEINACVHALDKALHKKHSRYCRDCSDVSVASYNL